MALPQQDLQYIRDNETNYVLQQNRVKGTKIISPQKMAQNDFAEDLGLQLQQKAVYEIPNIQMCQIISMNFNT